MRETLPQARWEVSESWLPEVVCPVASMWALRYTCACTFAHASRTLYTYTTDHTQRSKHVTSFPQKKLSRWVSNSKRQSKSNRWAVHSEQEAVKGESRPRFCCNWNSRGLHESQVFHFNPVIAHISNFRVSSSWNLFNWPWLMRLPNSSARKVG